MSPTPAPPSLWYCDACGQTIVDPVMSLVVWKSDEESRGGDFLVVHKGDCDPGSKGTDTHTYSLEVSEFLGDNGRAYLLSMLSLGPIMAARGAGSTAGVYDRDGYVDLFRRMQVPLYEEARRHFACPEVVEEMSDVNEYYPYRDTVLARIIAHGGECYA